MMLALATGILLAIPSPESDVLDSPDTTFEWILDSGVPVHIVPERMEWFGPRSYSLVGRVHSEPASTVVLAVRRGELWGRIDSDAGRFRVRRNAWGSGAYRVESIDSEVARPARAPVPVAARTARGDVTDDGALLDVLVVYTPKARRAAGSRAAIEALVQLGVTDANLAMERSAVRTRLRLVHVGEVDYEEAGDVQGDLELLQRASDGAADEVHALRDRHGADFVQLVVEEGDGCGIAFLMGRDDPGFREWAFSVVERDCIDRSFGLAHELGHNLGCDHAPEDPTSTPVFEFSHGFKDLGAGFRTLMAYGPGRRLARFSNPRLAFRGMSTGSAASDNTRSINRVRRTLANFRRSAPAPRIVRPGGTELGPEPVRFEWVMPGGDVSEWWLVAGTTLGGRDLFDSGSLGRARATDLIGLPADGGPVFVRLWYRRDSVWLFEDFEYRSTPR